MRFTLFALALACVCLLSFANAQHDELLKRQAAAGGGGGVTTSYTGVQTISGYTPPPSSAYGVPSVSAGTIMTTISGYGNTSNTGGSGGSSSGALSLVQTPQFTIIAAGLTTFLGVTVVAALGLAF